MIKYYLTDIIYLENNKLYHNEKLIKDHNWHKLLSEYGWKKLHIQWIKKLNKYLKEMNVSDLIPRVSNSSFKNSLFGCLDCGGDGDCFLHCLCYALNSKNIDTIVQEYDIHKLRNNISDMITYDKYNEIINIYKILVDSDDFDEDWDPYTIQFNEFKKKIIEGGNEYWCDNILINMIRVLLNINIIILNSNEIENKYYHYPILYQYDKNLNTILLLYENNHHFKLIGYFYQNNMITYFDKNNIPNEILKLIQYL